MQELKEVKALRIKDVINIAISQLHDILGLEILRVVAATKTEDGWRLIVEIIERKAVPDTQDLLGTYEVHLDEEGELLEYERTDIRRRMDLMESVD
jgi:EAL domain-containing protein (putative c-di-GMP-specific phosphodiesterase class I)